MKIDGNCLHKGKVMSKEIKIAYYKNNCNPFVRFVLRSVYLLNHTKVFFQRVNSEQADNNQQLIDVIAKHQIVNTLTEDETVMSFLCKINNDREKIDRTLKKNFIYLFTKESVNVSDDGQLSLWVDYYGDKASIRTKENKKINKVNKLETNTYLELFAKEKEELGNKKTAPCETLLETIPCDVDSIADVGCGPGLVNRWIPYYYNVLGIDIDENILAQCERDTCIGDILSLPLEDKSVDMTLSMDVLEHIESDCLTTAVSELQRVSKKYIYIQVPYEEILRYGVARCPECGNIWHVNFHKNSFDLQKLRQFETDEWKICQVNYTGDVDNTEKYREVYSRIEEMGLPVYRVDGFTCPVCGAKSKKYNCNILDEWIEKNTDKSYSLPIIPNYSEIGVLFCRDNQYHDSSYINNQDCFAKYPSYSSGEIDFCKDFFVRGNYVGDEQIPFVLNSDFSKLDKGTEFSRNNGFDNFVFPFDLRNTDLRLLGESIKDQIIGIYAVHRNGKEVLIKKHSVKKGMFDLLIPVDKNNLSHLIRIYHEGLILYKMSSSSHAKRVYNFIKSVGKLKHRITYRNGVKYLYYIPTNGIAVEGNMEMYKYTDSAFYRSDACIVPTYKKNTAISRLCAVIESGAFEASFKDKIESRLSSKMKKLLIKTAGEIINNNEYAYYLLKKCKADVVYKWLIGRR